MLSEQVRSAFVALAKVTHKTDFNALVEVLRKRKIGKILHFTHADNLESILSIGIQTKSEVIDSKIKFIFCNCCPLMSNLDSSSLFSMVLPHENKKGSPRNLLQVHSPMRPQFSFEKG